MYRVVLERSAERDLHRLSAEMHERVIAAIRGLAANPRPPGCRKLTGSENDWRIRVGDYRVVYEIADEIRVVRVNRERRFLPLRLDDAPIKGSLAQFLYINWRPEIDLC